MAGTLFVVATPIGNLEDITARALRVLREADLIAAEDTRRTAHLLTRFGITTRTTSLHEHNEYAKSGGLVERLIAGENIALVSDAGTPGISDPGAGLVREALEAGIRIEPIPGANAIISLLSVSGLDTRRFAFLGFPPTKSKDRTAWFRDLAASGPLVVFYEAPHRIRRTLEELLGLMGDIPVLVGRELTKAHEELVRGPISVVLSALPEPRGEFVVAAEIGDMANKTISERPSARQIGVEFGQLTNNGSSTRRQAVATLARRFRMSAREVYAAIEESKNSVV
jgi:16S rRNA (cytidine1402-2'-O)-methyltransferase